LSPRFDARFIRDLVHPRNGQPRRGRGKDRSKSSEIFRRSAFAKGEADIVVRTVKTGTTWAIDSISIGASPEMRKLLGLQG